MWSHHGDRNHWDLEMLEREGTFNANFRIDYVKAHELMASFMHGTEVWVYVKCIRRLKSGCLLYHTVYDHYLGPNNLDHMVAKCDTRRITSTYNGKQR